jgi:hypothetical protein
MTPKNQVGALICGPKIENGVYSHELDKQFDSPNAINVTKTSRLRYAGHMIRRPEDLLVVTKNSEPESQIAKNK